MTYGIVVNGEEQYSVWPNAKELPAGWNPVGFSANRDECLARIADMWTDIRPSPLVDTSLPCPTRNSPRCCGGMTPPQPPVRSYWRLSAVAVPHFPCARGCDRCRPSMRPWRTCCQRCSGSAWDPDQPAMLIASTQGEVNA
jgi:MbtH protein